MQRKYRIIESLLSLLSAESQEFAYLKNKRHWPLTLKILGGLSKSYEEEFFFLTFSLIGKLAYSDGRIQSWQHQVIEEFMGLELNLTSRQKALAFKVLRESRSLNIPFQDLAVRYFKKFGRSKRMLEHLTGILLDIALADNRYTQAEKSFLKTTIKILGISREEFNSIRKRQIILKRLRQNHFEKIDDSKREKIKNKKSEARVKADDNSPYIILGVLSSDSEETIKKSYRKLVMRYHPDRLRSSGLSQEFLARATQNFFQIQRAYETICSERGF